MTDSISDLFARSLTQLCTDERIRSIESGADDGAALWAEVDALGFTDALVSAKDGGAGLSLAQMGALLATVGYCGLNHPFGETMAARALLRSAGATPDEAPIALGNATSGRGQSLVCRDVPGARLARHVLLEWREEWLLMPVGAADCEPGIWRPRATATLTWESAAEAVFRMPRQGAGAGDWCNAIHAALMAGAMERVLELSVRYANDRRQFGRAIGQFQAVQQDLAVLAEQAGSAAVGARIGCAGGAEPDALLAATAMLRASEAALRVATQAHAVHGAIGITEEHVLGVFTSRLHEARDAGMGERGCAELLGRALFQSGSNVADFVRASLAPLPIAEI